MKVVVVGGGVIGGSIALALAERGAQVVLVERGAFGREASFAAAGILGAQAESHQEHAWFSRFLDARAALAKYAVELEGRTGIHVGYTQSGTLRLADDEASWQECEATAAWQRRLGAEVELFSAHELIRLEPTLSGPCVGALRFADDGQIDPRKLVAALESLIAHDRNVELRVGAQVERLVLDLGRVRGVVVAGETWHADQVVLAAGAWASALWPASAVPRAVVPVRGQVIELQKPGFGLRHVVFSPSGYVVPRGDGRVLCGATSEHVGYTRQVTAEGVSSLLRMALRCAPSLGAAEFIGSWSGFRPYLASGPVVDPSEIPGLTLAIGHHRNGILLSKWTADRVANLLCGTRSVTEL